MPFRSRSVPFLSAVAVVAVAAGALVAAAAPASAAPLDLTASQRLNPTGYRTQTGALSPRLSTLSALSGSDASKQAAAVGLPLAGAGSLRRDAAGRVLVDVLAHDSAGLAAARAAGLAVVAADPSLLTETGWIAPAALPRLAATKGVRAATEVLTPITTGDGATTSADAAPAAAACAPVVDEADVQLKAATARTTFGVDGTGVTVGVLSDSYNHVGTVRTAAQDVKSGDLPGTGNPCGRTKAVNVLDDTAAGGHDEGRAMLQHVHDLAPGAKLAFASAFNGLTSFAANITKLQKAGAKVISDDVTYFNEPFFQAGPVDVAIAAAKAKGVTYTSSAANNNIRVNGKDVGSYEAPKARMVTCATGIQCHDFNAGSGTTDINYGYLVPAGSAVAIDLQWDEPWFGVTDDFDIQLQDSVGNVVARSATDNLTSQQPFEVVQWANNTGADQAIFAFISRQQGRGTGSPRLKTVELGNGAAVSDVEYRTPTGSDVVGPQIFGHNGGAAVVSTAAVPYDNKNAPEVFSSPGPVTLYHGPVNGTTPAPKLGTPKKLAKPDLAATDGAATTFFGQKIGGVWRFYGTSAAAPHAAAVAALLLDAKPSLTPDALQNALRSTAAVIANGTKNRSGSGLVNANAAVGSVVPTR